MLSQQTEKTLKVVEFPQDGKYVPSVRVAGKWLERFGFAVGDKVIVTATEGRIIIARKEIEADGSTMV